MKESERRQIAALIDRITKKEISEALNKHLACYEHKKKPVSQEVLEND
jgi:hypothetical protein